MKLVIKFHYQKRKLIKILKIPFRFLSKYYAIKVSVSNKKSIKHIDLIKSPKPFSKEKVINFMRHMYLDYRKSILKCIKYSSLKLFVDHSEREIPLRC